jgi:hypothetical protein
MGNKQTAPTGPDEVFYHQTFPYYAELSALTEIRMKPGLGIPLRSGIGGHSLLYLNGVRRDLSAGYPVIKLCEPDAAPAHQGVGLSVNSHYRNANWVAVDGPDFLWRGALAPGEGVTPESYARTQDLAKDMGVLDGIDFHRHFFRDQPEGMSDFDFCYEITVATDYAARFGRDIFRTRVPLDRARMAIIVDYLNALNAPYREGKKIFTWKVLNNNCTHVAHNALAAAGIWAPWPTGQFFAIAAFNFPVPKNEYVDLAMRTNDLPIGDIDAIYRDEAARRALLENGNLPTVPGALSFAESAIRPNDIYDIEALRIIFYDNPFWGPYKPRLKRILTEPRYGDLRANLKHFEALYAEAIENRRNRVRASSPARDSFEHAYDRHITSQAEKIEILLAQLDPVPARVKESVP